ncbi:hypothetical protein MIDIC_330009 [Alphaproteobacteria bacterium]
MQIIIGNPNLAQGGIDAMVGMTATGICCVFQRMEVVFKKEHFTKKRGPKTKEEFLEEISSIS